MESIAGEGEREESIADGLARYEARKADGLKQGISGADPVVAAMEVPGLASCYPSQIPSGIAKVLGRTLADYDDICSRIPNMDGAFYHRVLREIASSQLSLGHSVVIHSHLLSCRQHVDALLELADCFGIPLVIIGRWCSKTVESESQVSSSGGLW